MLEIKRYLRYLDEIEDFLDEEDETAGVPADVCESMDRLYDYFMELYMIRRKYKTPSSICPHCKTQYDHLEYAWYCPACGTIIAK